jgi:hypothetical protein
MKYRHIKMYTFYSIVCVYVCVCVCVRERRLKKWKEKHSPSVELQSNIGCAFSAEFL